MNKRIDYLDGLKLFMCYGVMIMHYFLAFLPSGFVGFGSGVEDSEKLDIIVKNLPISLVVNSSLVLYVFFALSSLITTIVFYKTKNQQTFIEKQCVKRYFRFVIPIAAAILITFGLHTAGVLNFKGAYELSGSGWNLAVEPWAKTWKEAIYIAFIKSYLLPDNAILTVLWCMDIIFIGSFLTYGFLACMGNSRMRYAAYIVLALLGIIFPKYLIYLVGIVCGDFYVHGYEKVKLTGIKKELAGIGSLILGIAVGIIPACILPEQISVIVMYCAGSLFIIIGIMFSGLLQKVLSMKIILSQAKYSFSLLLVQIPVMFGISYYSFVWIEGIVGNYIMTFCINAILFVVITHLISVIFFNVFEKPSIKLADWVYQRLLS